MIDELKVFAGNSNRILANQICEYLGIPLGEAELRKFSDGEIFFKICENIRSSDIFIIQSTNPPSDNLFELLLMTDAFRRASAGRITAVIPYFGYARQDRKDQPRVAIGAKLCANLLITSGAERILTIDLHAGQIQGFFDIPVDHLFAAPVVLDYIRKNYDGNIIVVSPDAGGVERARAFAKRLNTSLAIIDKRRVGPNTAEVMNIIGDVDGKTCIIVDDIVDTAGTLTQSVNALIKNGAKKVTSCCTHPVLSEPAIKRIMESEIDELVVTNTINIKTEALSCPKLRVLSIAPLLGEAIRRIHVGDSVSSLFV